ncbi:DUF1656 domain-containing protein [Paraburkholderia pallida]|uniref:DUF1656 domain-containing protein n=1 Tax=Paraburkholderia pallida TaxID=2547399 RepID=A0A4P7DAE4_9BURK|nr:DUF1656 domain-containing protein [Paraburkholderia pallida]QBR03712.1 DUF1656 domain-containing protein [Paraburkholderia pallida]
MPLEVDIFGFFAPVLLPVLVVCVIAFVILDLILARLRIYRFAWHPGLFRVALFIALFSGVSLIVQR